MEGTAETAKDSYYSLSQTGRCVCVWGGILWVFPPPVFPSNPLTQKGLCATDLFYRPPPLLVQAFIGSPMGHSNASPTAVLLFPASSPAP